MEAQPCSLVDAAGQGRERTATVMVKHLVKAVNQLLWSSFARDVVYPCRTQLCSHPCQPLVLLSRAFHHHGLKLCGWRGFTHHQVGVDKPQHTVGEAPNIPPSLVPPSVPCPGALLPLLWHRGVETTTHFFKNHSDFSLHFSLCLTCLSLTHCYVCGCSQCWCGFVYDTVIFAFWLLVSSGLHSFHINLGDQR